MTTTIKRTTDYEGDRYAYDFKLFDLGWDQVDTASDAAWYGTWANPATFETFTFCEGDITATCSSDAESFVAEMRKLAGWHQEREEWHGIDPGLNPEHRKTWEALGLGDLLYAEPVPA